MMAASYQTMANNAWEIYLKWKEKEERYDSIENVTYSLFEIGNSIRNTVTIGLADLKGAFQKGEFCPNQNAPWRKNLQDEIMDGLINLGIGEEKQVLICISRRLVNIIYGMLKNGTDYVMPDVKKDNTDSEEK